MGWETNLAKSDSAVQNQHWDATLAGSTHPIAGVIHLADIDDTRVDMATVAGDDASIVQRVLDGDSEAMGEMYDRHADRINTMCVHMMRDEDEGADICGQVFLTAFSRLHQLRDPAKLRPWLYAIARNEVYRRSRDRARVRPMQEVDDMQALSTDPGQFEAAGPDATAELPQADPAELAALVQAAAGGLDDRDRMVLELNLTQGLDGEELANALGVKVDNAYQMTHRMKERLERSMSALLVVRAGRDQCADLDGVARKWDGNYDVLWRKRFARHVDRCQRCQTMRSRLPKAILSGVALSQAAQSAVLAAPMSIRERVLSEAPSIVATETGRALSSDGFPKAPGQGRGLWRYFVGAFVALALVIGLSEAVGEGLIPIDVETTPDEPVPSTTVPLSGPSPTVAGSTPPTTAAPGGSGGTDGDAPGASPTTVVGETPPGETPPRNDPGDPGNTTPPTDGTPTPPADDPRDPPTYDPPTYDPKNPPTFSVPTVTFYFPTPTFYVPPTVVTSSSTPTIR
jgi:RNA polymerase sigma factor (sigma-70 family)